MPTSTGDDVIEKHACVVERAKMLAGQPAREQCFVIDGVNFLNNADLDGTTLPPPDAPNVMMAAGGTQLKKVMEASTISTWKFFTDWNDLSKTRLEGPIDIAVAPYHYLCDGQLTNCVPQPGTDRRLDAQGDKIMARLVYRRDRRLANRSSPCTRSTPPRAAAASAGMSSASTRSATSRCASKARTRPTASIDGWPARRSIGSATSASAIRSAARRTSPASASPARLANDPPGVLSLKETVLVEGEAAQTNTIRWEDYTQTAIDPSDDCTIWYVGDYLKKDATSYSSRIGAFRLPGCPVK